MPPSPSSPHVVVVGGGVSGLAAAHRLARDLPTCECPCSRRHPGSVAVSAPPRSLAWSSTSVPRRCSTAARRGPACTRGGPRRRHRAPGHDQREPVEPWPARADAAHPDGRSRSTCARSRGFSPPRVWRARRLTPCCRRPRSATATSASATSWRNGSARRSSTGSSSPSWGCVRRARARDLRPGRRAPAGRAPRAGPLVDPGRVAATPDRCGADPVFAGIRGGVGRLPMPWPQATDATPAPAPPCVTWPRRPGGGWDLVGRLDPRPAGGAGRRRGAGDPCAGHRAAAQRRRAAGRAGALAGRVRLGGDRHPGVRRRATSPR